MIISINDDKRIVAIEGPFGVLMIHWQNLILDISRLVQFTNKDGAVELEKAMFYANLVILCWRLSEEYKSVNWIRDMAIMKGDCTCD